MARLFGTDGVRGTANKELTVEMALKLGQAGAIFLWRQGSQRKKKKEKEREIEKTIVIGRDTRISGDMLEGALIAGITSMGVHVVRLGIIPTPGVAYMVKQLKACGGIMISASHNPIADNGIKFFSHDGFKLWDDEEEEIERLMAEGVPSPEHRPTGLDLGEISERSQAREEYLQYLLSTIGTDLKGLHIVLDTAHGAASNLGEDLFERLGASVTTIHSTPDGSRINISCGATHTEDLRERVLKEGAHVGLALDGDADRLIMVDEKGQVLDGDFCMAICGRFLKEEDRLTKDAIVATPYSNLGLKDSLKKKGIDLIEAKNGDRYVMERMLEEGIQLGGEQSGHIIFLEDSTTGDGLLSALKVLEVMKREGERLSSLARVMEKYPQVLKNVSVERKDWEREERVERAIEEVKRRLGNTGRTFIRASGTEPVIRVMVEGRDRDLIEELALDLVRVLEETMNVDP